MLSVLGRVSAREPARTPLARAPKVGAKMAETHEGFSVRRLAAAVLVALIGLAIAAGILVSARAADPSLAGWAVVGLGIALAVVLVVAGVLLYRARFTPAHTLRVAGWAVLGTVLLGFVIELIVLGGTPMPLYAAATLLAVSAVAHVLVGVRAVQRIRASELARRREQFEVLNRLVRHNLRNEAQLLLFAAERLERDDVSDHDVADDLEAVAEDLSEMNDVLDRSQALIREEAGPATTIDLRELLVDLAEEYREAYPDASIELVLPEECRVRSGEQLELAVAELLENALEHTGRAPRVTVDASNRPKGVLLEISDDGPGIPEEERAVVERGVDIDQLDQGKGLGLWFVRWVLDAYGGDIEFDVDDDGTTVRLALPAA